MVTYKLVMPEDMNQNGFLFGGKMLLWIDEIAWLSASAEHPGLNFVTIGMSDVMFKQSVPLKSILRFVTEKKKVGTTSVTYHVDVFSRKVEDMNENHVFHTDITFVRIDKNGKKMQISAPME